MVDKPASETGAERREGSNPFFRTNKCTFQIEIHYGRLENIL